MIRLEGVTKRYPGVSRPAVDHLDLDIPEGTICVLIGPSGCGKTTSMRMVNRLIEPTAGRILVAGEDVSGTDPVRLRRTIGYVIQQVGLFPHMSVAENVATVPALLGWPKPRIAARVEEMLTLVGLEPREFLRRFPGELSGGQRQRVGVARALAADPPVMLMDEPFGAVDPIVRERLQSEFLAILRRLRKTIILVTHDIDEAIRMGDRLALMKDGLLMQYDTPDRILATPRDAFVAEFLGIDRGLKRLALVTAGEAAGPSPAPAGSPRIASVTTLRDALSILLTEGADAAAVVDADGASLGSLTLAAIRSSARGTARSAWRRIALRLGLGGLIEQNPIGVRARRLEACEPQLREHAGHAGIHRAVDERSAKPVDRSGVGRRGSDEERHRRRRGRFDGAQPRCGLRLEPSQKLMIIGIERTDVDFARQQALRHATGRHQRADRLPEQPGLPAGAMAQEVVPDGVEARLRVLDRPADAAAEGVGELPERSIGRNGEIGPVHGASVAARKRRQRRRDRLHGRLRARERVAAHEGEAEVPARPQRLERRRSGMIDIDQRDAGSLGDPCEEALPKVPRRRVDGVHAGIGDERRHAKRSRWPIPSRAAFSSIAAPSAMSESDRPRCQNRMVSSLVLAAGLEAGDDLAQLGVQRRLGQLAGVDVRAQRPERTALALAPVVDDDLRHDVGERQLDRAHRAVGHDERARA